MSVPFEEGFSDENSEHAAERGGLIALPAAEKAGLLLVVPSQVSKERFELLIAQSFPVRDSVLVVKIILLLHSIRTMRIEMSDSTLCVAARFGFGYSLHCWLSLSYSTLASTKKRLSRAWLSMQTGSSALIRLEKVTTSVYCIRCAITSPNPSFRANCDQVVRLAGAERDVHSKQVLPAHVRTGEGPFEIFRLFYTVQHIAEAAGCWLGAVRVGPPA